MTFFSSEAELALMAPDDGMGHLYPSSTCQSPPSIMYSPPLHHMAHRPSTTMSGHTAMYTPPQDYRPVMDSPYPPHALWSTQPSSIPLPQVTSYSYPSFSGMASPPMLAHDSTLLSQSFGAPRPSRSHSTSSTPGRGIPSNVPSETSPPALSRSLSPSSPDLRSYGIPNKNGGGFSSKKDLARHEAKHNPGVLCDWEGCDRVFSRVDNMRDHVKRIHLKASRKSSTTST
ncbi:hypothetical protein AA0116_g8824 [Alternaria tenuissima]|nr:hypothetical protein AA0116_g8824 [Alternaria tenuissima]